MEGSRVEKARIAKERIMEAATELFSQKDFEEVSMQEIAKAANCTAGNIYHYFSSKEELMLHTMDSLDEKYQKFYHELQTAPEYRELPVSRKLQLFLEEVMYIMSEGKHLTNVYIYVLKRPQSGMMLLSESRFVYRTYQEMIAQMQADGELPAQQDPQVILKQIVTLTRGIMMEWLFHERKEDIREISRALFDVYFRGLLQKSV